MPQLSQEFLTQALQLPEDQRGELADRLIASLHPAASGTDQESIRAAWTAECRRRMADSDAGLPGIPLEEAWPRIAGNHA